MQQLDGIDEEDEDSRAGIATRDQKRDLLNARERRSGSVAAPSLPFSSSSCFFLPSSLLITTKRCGAASPPFFSLGFDDITFMSRRLLRKLVGD